LVKTKIITLKTQLNAENVCVKRLSQRSLKDELLKARDRKRCEPVRPDSSVPDDAEVFTVSDDPEDLHPNLL